MAQWVDCLLYRYQGPSTLIKTWAWWHRTITITRSRKVEIGGSLELVNHSVQPVSGPQVHKLLTRKVKKQLWKKLNFNRCFHRPTRVSTPEHTYRFSYTAHTYRLSYSTHTHTIISLSFLILLLLLLISSVFFLPQPSWVPTKWHLFCPMRALQSALPWRCHCCPW